MNFNQEQTDYICKFMMDFNGDLEFKANMQDRYDSDLKSLSILDIYALEEVLREGNKGIYKKFLEAKSEMAEDVAVKTYDEFVRLLQEDAAFMQYKKEQVLYSPETLSPIEMLAFLVVGMPEEEKKYEENSEEEAQEENTSHDAPLEYDPLNPIKSATENQVRETLENLVFGEFILRVLEHPAMWEIKGRCDGGKIANVDKTFIIEKIRHQTLSDDFPERLKQIVDSRYIKVQMALLLGKSQEEAFSEYLPYNTNISAKEILGVEKANIEEEMFKFFQDLVNNRREKGPQK